MMMTEKEFKRAFAVFILSHGRAKEISTVRMLKSSGYTGDWFVVIDNEDDQADMYYKKFGQDHVIMFDKAAEARLTDTGDLDEDRRVGVFARNRIETIAAEMGYKYHLQLDDDFNGIAYRYISGGRLAVKRCRQLDKLFFYMTNFMDKTDITWLSFALSCDYLGGIKSKRYASGLIPKTMGSFLMRADDPIKFCMRMNDDITTTVLHGTRGKLFFSVMYMQVQTPATQHMRGGMTDIYRDNGTYRKSFYSVMCCPSCVKIAKQGITHFRIHHKISWNNARPKILNEKWKKVVDHGEV